jgi:hypothetical protein
MARADIEGLREEKAELERQLSSRLASPQQQRAGSRTARR